MNLRTIKKIINPKFIGRFWTVITTIATLVLGLYAFNNERLAARIESREKLDQFMLKIKEDRILYCNFKKEKLKPLWEQYYNDLVESANLEKSLSPYDTPCKNFRRLGPPVVSLTGRPSKYGIRYESLREFLSTEEKEAIFWIDDVPIKVDGFFGDEYIGKVKEVYRKRHEEILKCDGIQQNKAENTYNNAKCLFALKDNNEVVMKIYYTVTSAE